MKKYLLLYLLLILFFIDGNKVFAESQEVDTARKDIGLEEAIKKGLTGKSVKIAVIDSGFDLRHSDLTNIKIGEGVMCTKDHFLDLDGSGRMLPTSLNHFECDTDTSSDWMKDPNDHGTGVLGISAGQKNEGGIVGVAPEATYYPIRINDDNGDTDITLVSAAIYWAVDKGVDIINISKATTCLEEGDEGYEDDDTVPLFKCDAVFIPAINYANEHGVMIIAGAGNLHNTDGSVNNMAFPAAYEDVLAVGGYDTFTNKRCTIPKVMCAGSTGPNMDLVAPYSVVAPYVSPLNPNGYRTNQGTSNSSPLVAGAAALMIEQLGPNHKKISVKDKIELLKSFTIPIDDSETNTNEYGAGQLQIPFLSTKNPFFSVWIDEMDRNSISKLVYDDEISSDSSDRKYSTYKNHILGYNFDFPSYWFIDNVEPFKYVRFFLKDFKVEVSYDESKTEEKRKEYISSIVSHIPGITQETSLKDKNGNTVFKYKYSTSPLINNQLTENMYYFIDVPDGVFTFKVTTNKENLEKGQGLSIESEMKELISTFSNFGQPLTYYPFAFTENFYNERVSSLFKTSDYEFALPPSKTLFGIYVPERLEDASKIASEKENSLGAKFGSQTIKGYLTNDANLYENGYPSTEFSDAIKKIIQNDKIPIVDLAMGYKGAEYLPDSIINGGYKKNIGNWAENLKALNAPVFVNLGSGMNGSIRNYTRLQRSFTDNSLLDTDADLYKLAFRYIVDQFRAHHANNVKFVWSPSVDSIPDISINDMTRFYPGDDYVDWINLMGYNIDGTDKADLSIYLNEAPLIDGKTRTFDEVFKNAYHSLRRMYPDKPMMMETSSLNRNNSKSAFAQQMFNKLLTEYGNIQIVTWNNGVEGSAYADYATMDVTQPSDFKTMFASHLNDSTKVSKNALYDYRDGTLTLDDTKQTFTFIPSAEEPNPPSSTSPAGTYNYIERYGDWYYIEIIPTVYKWVNPKMFYTTYNKNIFVISKVVSLYKEQNDTIPYSALGSQGVFATDKWVNKETGQIWYKINTSFAGPLWLCVYPNQIAEGSTFPITLTQTTPIYNNPNDTSTANQVSTLGIQTVNGISRSGGWAAIQTWLGNKWMNVSGSYAMVGTVTTINKWIPITNGTYMHNFPYDATKLSTALGAQNVLAKAMWVDPDSLNNGKFTTWYKINTYLGDKWIKQ